MNSPPGCTTGSSKIPDKILKNVDPNLFVSENGVCQLNPSPPPFLGALLTPPPPGSENPTCPGRVEHPLPSACDPGPFGGNHPHLALRTV